MFQWKRASNDSGGKKSSVIAWLNRPTSSSSSTANNNTNEEDTFDENNGASTRQTRRISIPASRRLTAITEDSNVSSTISPHIPPRNPARTGGGVGTVVTFPSTPPSTGTPTRWSGRRVSRFSEDTDIERPAPPSYEWVHNPSEDDIFNPADDEKLAELRAGRTNKKSRRGGWGRLAAVIILLLVIAIALGVGLGVGLTRKNNNNDSKDGAKPAPSIIPTQPPTSKSFPVGTYSIPATLKSAQTDCVSKSATWSCYPYTIGEKTNFDWVIANTSEVYATADTNMTTSASGVPANLTVEASNNLFGITFTPQNLTYVSTSGNSTNTKLIFEFSMTKSVVTNAQLMVGQTGTPQYDCFFNNTAFLGTLYLSPDSGTGSTNALGNWPYAVDISQSAAGGGMVPNCYASGIGRVDPASEPSSEMCLCSYKNY